jgi:hypothetical protein
MSNLDESSSLLLETVDRLTGVGIPYMVSGSFAVLVYGHPRVTQDIDIVIAPDSEQLQSFVSRIPPNQYVSAEAVKAALKNRSLFNVIDTNTGWKVDLFVRKSRPFSLEEFRRRRAVEFAGRTIDVVSPEDSILSKLEWSKNGNSERQLRDAESVAVVQWKNLDQNYLQQWAAELEVEHELNVTLERARAVVEPNE